MRALVLGTALAASLPGLAAAHHAAPVVIVTSAGPPRPIYTGRPAHIPLTLLPDGAPAGGTLEPDSVAAIRMLRPEAVVLKEAVDFEGVQIAAGTVMVRAELESEAGAGGTQGRAGGVWCSTRLMPTFHSATQDCLKDEDGDGRFKAYWVGYTAEKDAPFSLIGLDGGKLLPAPVAYRSAKPEEMPVVEIGYRVCRGEGDGQAIPYRFSPVLRTARGDWTATARPCPFGQWPNGADKSVEEVDGLTMQIAAGAPPTYRVLKGLPSGPLAPLRIGESVRLKGSTSAKTERLLEALGARALLPAGPPEVTRAAVVAHGDDIAWAMVRHGVTGVLRNDVQIRGLVGETYAAGSYVYGIPMHTSSLGYPRPSGVETEVTWCAPRIETVEGRTHVTTTCFPTLGESVVAEPVGPALMVTSFTMTRARPVVGFAVERRPATLGAPMQLTYVFDHWIGDRIGADKAVLLAQVGVEIRVNSVMTPIGHVLVAPNRDAVIALPFMGGAVSLTPIGKDGAPVPATAQVMSREDVSGLMARIDGRRARAVVIAPPADKPILPLAGLVGYEPKPGFTPMGADGPATASTTGGAAIASGPGAP